MSNKEMADKINHWINKGDGKKIIRKACKEAEEYINKLRGARKLDSKALNEPFTI